MHNFLKDNIARYSKVSDEDWNTISSKFSPKLLKKGFLYLEEGTVCKKVAFIINGALRTFQCDNYGDEITTDFAFPGSFATVLSSLIYQKPSLQNLSTMEDTQLLEINYKNLQFLIKTIPSFGIVYQKIMEEEFLCVENRKLILQNKSAAEKYKLLLTNNKEIILKTPLIYIASYLGISAETLSRVRKKL